MTRFQKFVLVLAVVLIGVAGIVGAVYYFTQGAADAATRFFATIAISGPNAAYLQASPAFRQAESEASFTGVVERMGLRHFKNASWPSRNISNNEADMAGTLTLDNAATLPAKIKLLRDAASGRWQVFSVNIDNAGSHVSPSASNPEELDGKPPVPPSAPLELHANTNGTPGTTPAPPKITSTSQATDKIAAEIGGNAWALEGKNIVIFKLGDQVHVEAVKLVQSQQGAGDIISLSLQFDDAAAGTQTLNRDCQGTSACLELHRNGDQFKVDSNSAAPSSLQITSVQNGEIEGNFSANMVSLDGKLAIRDGHFHLTVKAP